jgi:hypothetical protein
LLSSEGRPHESGAGPRYGKPHLGDLAAAVARLPSLTDHPDQQPAALRATGTDRAIVPTIGPALAPILAPTVDREREGLRTVESTAVRSDASEMPCFPGILRLSENGSERLISVEGEGQNGWTPGDRRRASSLGEELVPKGK